MRYEIRIRSVHQMSFFFSNVVFVGNLFGRNNDDEETSPFNKTMSLEAALMYDSLLVLATAAKNLEYHMDSILFQYQTNNVSCKKEIPWMEGTTFFNYLNAVTVTGITGNISFQVIDLLCNYFSNSSNY